MIRRGASQRRPSESPSGTANNSIHSATANLAGDRELGDMSSEAVTQKRLDRTKSVKTRSGHNHHRSSSRSKQEQKSVGEYALHHLFNKVGHPQACRSDSLTDKWISLLCKPIIK